VLVTSRWSPARVQATPMEARLANHVWTLEELVAMLPESPVKKSTKDRDLLWKALGESA
jgi:hypothetical protein